MPVGPGLQRAVLQALNWCLPWRMIHHHLWLSGSKWQVSSTSNVALVLLCSVRLRIVHLPVGISQ